MAVVGRFELVLMRHGEAEEFADGGDAGRALTQRGHGMAQRAGRLMRALAWTPTIAISSPYLRARQTLEGVLEALEAPTGMETEPGLVPGAPASSAVATLIERASVVDDAEVRMLAVGHNPCVTGMLGHLVRGDDRMAFAVSPGDLAHLSVDPREGTAVVRSYIPARVLEVL